MSRFAVIYEDPEYEQWADEHDEGDWQDIYVEPGTVKSFDEWTPEAQQRLIQDIFSPYITINS
jgi:hypothetical protein